MKQVLAYTDGSASVGGENAGRGGFGVYFPDLFGKRRGFSLGFKNALTGQMEVSALLYVLKALPTTHKEPIELVVYSDSEYVVKTFTENRIYRWRENGWRNSSGEVKNKALWKIVLSMLEKKKYITLSMVWIKSHQLDKCKTPEAKRILLKNPHVLGNSVADRLADYKRHKNLLESVLEINFKKFL